MYASVFGDDSFNKKSTSVDEKPYEKPWDKKLFNVNYWIFF